MKLQPSDLTFHAEKLGKRHPPPLRWLAILTGHGERRRVLLGRRSRPHEREATHASVV